MRRAPGRDRRTERHRPFRIAFIWDQLAPYCIDRCEDVARSYPKVAVVAVQITSSSNLYSWAPIDDGDHGVSVATLIPALPFESTTWAGRSRAILAFLWSSRCDVLFISNYQRVDVLVASAFQRLLGRRVCLMFDSKSDDMPRRLWRELCKWAFLTPYSGAIVSGPRSLGYLQFFGFKTAALAEGYDTISVHRVRNEAKRALSAPIGFTDRPFVIVARLVEKKSIDVTIRAYARYLQRCRLSGTTPHGLVVLGEGPLKSPLIQLVRRLGLSDEDVIFAGWQQTQQVSDKLAEAVALVLMSSVEQWGLVVNEAIALDVPIICTRAVGAADVLVRSSFNGFTIDVGNVDACADAMIRLGATEETWKQYSLRCKAFRSDADVGRFSLGVGKLLDL